MKKFALAIASSLLLAAPAFACPEEAGGESMKKTADKTKAKPDGAKDSAPKGTPGPAGGPTQKEAPKATDKKSS